MNKALKITDNNEYELSAKDIAAIHYGYCLTYGKVAYTTGIAFDNTKNLEHILLVVGDEKPVFYWCHVEKFYSYGSGPKGIEKSMDEYSPEIYKEQPNTTWILFDKMEHLPQDFTDVLYNKPDLLSELIETPRYNQKEI